MLSRIIICWVELVFTMDGFEDLWVVLAGDSVSTQQLKDSSASVDESSSEPWSLSAVDWVSCTSDDSVPFTRDACSCKSSVKMSIILLIPIKYPSSWLPTVHALL